MMLFLMICTATAVAQNIQVKGTVTDKTFGDPIMGATVQVAGGNGTVTDLDGNFTLNVKEGAQLTFSFIGMKSQTLPAAETMNVVLEEDATGLNEVVVTGYTTQKKADLTGAVSVVDRKSVV